MNGWGGLLWVVCIVKVSVTTSCVMGKCGTCVIACVFRDVRESIELPDDGGWLRDNAVSLYFFEKPHFTLATERKVFKNNV